MNVHEELGVLAHARTVAVRSQEPGRYVQRHVEMSLVTRCKMVTAVPTVGTAVTQNDMWCSSGVLLVYMYVAGYNATGPAGPVRAGIER